MGKIGMNMYHLWSEGYVFLMGMIVFEEVFGALKCSKLRKYKNLEFLKKQNLSTDT